MAHFIPAAAREEKCTLCGEQATHKIAEEHLHDIHGFPASGIMVSMSAYLCCDHYKAIFKLLGCALEATDEQTGWIKDT